MATATGSTKQQQGAGAEAQQQPQVKRDPHAVQTRWFVAAKGKPIEVTLTNGATLAGILSAVDQYSFTLREADGRLALLFKHAVAVLRIAAAEGGENGKSEP